MKTNNTTRKHYVRNGFIMSGLAAAAGLFIAAMPAPKYVAHEWGTFTSVQGSDGVLLEWQPLETSQLPKFVYDWNRPGHKELTSAKLGLGKSDMVSLQRMETPVIYFYSEREQAVDVSVQFPKGLITEWYPQAAQVSFFPSNPEPLRKQSAIKWADVRILPEKQTAKLEKELPLDSSGSHYFAARETDSDYLGVNSPGKSTAGSEHEKFIFYRGVGNFATPLRVTMTSEGGIVLANTGSEPLAHLVLLNVRNGSGTFTPIDKVEPGIERSVSLDASKSSTPITELSRGVGEAMEDALVKAGLYAREAKAMVRTWDTSWFQEEGVRVLYILPRAWTDEILPLQLAPQPRELVRVMVGRAEVITPAVQQQLANSIIKASQGDTQAKEQAIAEFRKLGRFGEPALRLATKGESNETIQSAWKLLQAAAAKPVNVAKSY